MDEGKGILTVEPMSLICTPVISVIKLGKKPT